MTTVVQQPRAARGRPDLVTGRPDDVDPENWDFAGEDTQYLLHNLHPYPARFIPQIPHRAIERWSEPGATVLDPFCGSGTTLLEAALAGRNSIGVDNNGVATLVARAKVASYHERDFRALTELASVVEAVSEGNQTLVPHAPLKPSPSYPSLPKWFSRESVEDLTWLVSQIDGIEEPAKLLALSVFSSIVVRASRQDSDTRYSATSRRYTTHSALGWWVTRMTSAIERAREVSHLRKPSTHQVYTADSRTLPFLAADSVSLIVTSPPYLNAYDYHKYHRHRLHWIGADVSFARDTEIGGHDTFTRPRAVPGPYFDDLRLCMKEWLRVLSPDGRALVAVGDAIVSHEFVPVGDRLVDLGRDVGLTLERRWVRTLDSARKSFNQSSRIKREHLLLFRRPRSSP